MVEQNNTPGSHEIALQKGLSGYGKVVDGVFQSAYLRG
jgi:hypothetical protein